MMRKEDSQSFTQFAVSTSLAQPPSATDNLKTSKGKDRNSRIKRPMNAYIIWARKQRSVVAKAYPNASAAEVSEQLGIEWRKMSEDQKMPYYLEASRLKWEHSLQFPDWEYKPHRQKRKQVCLDEAAPETSAIQNNLIFSVSLEKTVSPRRPDREPTPPHFPDDLLSCMPEPLFIQTSTLDFQETSIGMDLYDNTFLDYDDFSALDQYLFGKESVADSKDTSSRDTNSRDNHLSAGLKSPPVLETNALEEIN
ncbi:Transcription factor SOX-30 [Clarias magur]|uniref:Transcription factor SOX-30 n=1 Tax=Clarias magur TaxID=1594786 RepID=A0A8J4WZB0_CLAMG|nr:Transcription factor SOX-30 [Clarias magur]